MQVKKSNIHLTIFKQLRGYATGGYTLTAISTIVLFLLVVMLCQGITDYTVGFIMAIQERIHKRIIRRQRRWADRIVKKL